jgi:hypothetical protein
MTKLASTTVGVGGTASIDFTSIPATFTDLLLKLSARATSGGVSQVRIQFNSSGGTAYSDRTLEGSGSSASSFSRTSQSYIWATTVDQGTTSTFGNTEFYIPNYAGGNNKSMSVDVVTETNATAALMAFYAQLWSDVTAINQITLTANAGLFAQYSTASLYGIKKN